MIRRWRRCRRAALVSSVALVAATDAGAGAGAQNHALSIHFSTPQFTGCGALSDAVLSSCDVIRPGGVFHSVAQWGWIVLTGVPDGTGPGAPGGIGAIAFGLEHTLTAPVWDLCASATQVTDPTWPASGTGIAVTWTDECYLVEDNTIGATAIGIVTFDASETGLIQTAAHPSLGRATTTDCAGTVLTLCPNLLGSGDPTIGGTAGSPACGLTCATPTKEASWARVKISFAR